MLRLLWVIILALITAAGFGVCIWMALLNIRSRWNDDERWDHALPFSLNPGVTVRSWIGGAGGTVAFLSLMLLLRLLGWW